MGGHPSGLQVDIEFTAGVWTNVTAYVNLAAGIKIEYGRTESSGPAQVGTCSLTLDNSDGRFTVKSSASPYYPNMVPRKRLRVSYSAGASPRFVGYIKEINPKADENMHYVELECFDRSEALSRQSLDGIIKETISALNPTTYLPLDSEGVLQYTYGGSTSAYQIVTYGTSGDVYGLDSSPVPWVPGQWLKFSPDLSTAGVLDGAASVVCPRGLVNGATFTLFFAFAATPIYNSTLPDYVPQCLYDSEQGTGPATNGILIEIGDPTIPASVTYRTGVSSNAVLSTTTAATTDGNLHTLALVCSATGGVLYVDGVAVASGAGVCIADNSVASIGRYTPNHAGSGTGAPFKGLMAHVAAWQGTALSAGQIADIDNAVRNGFNGELSGARMSRITTLAGLTGSDVNLATGQQLVGPLICDGVSIMDALVATADAESGGAAVYVDVDGRLRFLDRTARSTATIGITLDAEDDLDGSGWQPAMDDYDRTDIGVVTNQRTGATVVYDQSSGVTMPSTTELEVSLATDTDAPFIAQYLVATGRPDLRLPQLKFDLMTSPNSATLYTALATMTIGTIVSVIDLPATMTSPTGVLAQVLPASRVDGYVEGWTEEIDKDSYVVTLDVSSAVRRFVLQASYLGRLVETAGTMTLTSTITSSATSASVTTVASNPLLTTAAGDYSPTPGYLKIDEEIVAVTAAPGGASPQTITISRGALGTVPQAHTAGATVTVVTGGLVL